MEEWARSRQEHFTDDPVAKAKEIDESYPLDARRAFNRRSQDIAFQLVCTSLNRAAGSAEWIPDRVRKELDPFEWEHLYDAILKFMRLRGAHRQRRRGQEGARAGE